MKVRTAVILGCGGIAILAGAVAVVVGIGLLHVMEDPEELGLTAEAPPAVKLGDTFKLIVRVANRDSERPIKLGDLDIGDDYLKGFSMLSIDPVPRSTEIDAANEWTTMRFGITLPPGAETELNFELRAERVGRYRGQIDQFVGVQFLSTVVETKITR